MKEFPKQILKKRKEEKDVMFNARELFFFLGRRQKYKKK